MKRSYAADEVEEIAIIGADRKMKKIKPGEGGEKEEEDVVVNKTSSFVLMDENLLYEVLKHADARTLATAACVSQQWHRTAQDERLWELICTRHWANIGCGNQQLRSVVLALGGGAASTPSTSGLSPSLLLPPLLPLLRCGLACLRIRRCRWLRRGPPPERRAGGMRETADGICCNCGTQ